MYRTLIDLPELGLAIPSYGALLALAAAVCLVVGPRWAARLEGLDRRTVRRALLVCAAAPWIGGRLHFVLNNWSLFSGRPSRIVTLTDGGLHAAGAMLALTIALPLAARCTGVSVRRLADGLTPTIGLGIAVARVGCFLQGCCFGAPCAHGWCVRFPTDAFVFRHHLFTGLVDRHAPVSAPVHPLQLYFAAVGLVVTGVALWTYRRKRFDGQVALTGLLTFSIGAAVLETLRADAMPRTYWGPLPALQWMALAMVALSRVLLLAARAARASGPSLGHAPRSVAGA